MCLWTDCSCGVWWQGNQRQACLTIQWQQVQDSFPHLVEGNWVYGVAPYNAPRYLDPSALYGWRGQYSVTCLYFLEHFLVANLSLADLEAQGNFKQIPVSVMIWMHDHQASEQMCQHCTIMVLINKSVMEIIGCTQNRRLWTDKLTNTTCHGL